jgi:hypothetical protein
VKVEKLKCSFCDSEKDVRLLPVPIDVITDEEGNIKWVVERFELPTCFECRRMLGFDFRTYNWIEEILKTKFSDGRKRIVDLILMPFLVNIKRLSYEEVERKIEEWFKLCNYSRRQYGKQLVYQYRYIANRNLVPMSKARFEAELKQYASDENG